MRAQPEETVTSEDEAPAAPARKPAKRTRSRTAKATDVTPEETPAVEEEAPAASRRTTTRSKTAATSKKATASSRSSRSRKAETDVSAADTSESGKKSARTRRKAAAAAEEPAAPAPASENDAPVTAPQPAKKTSRRRTSTKTDTPAAETPEDVTPASPRSEKKTPARPARQRRKAAETVETETADAPQQDETPADGQAVTETDGGILFSDLGLSEPILRAVEEMGYTHPTPIQAQAVPEILAGRDVLGVAQTGTGKTASFTLPMLEKLSKSRARARMPRSLILEPTRELALQVAENFKQYGAHLRLTHALLIGGGKMNEQKELLNRGVDVLIATPGRLLDMFERGGLLMTQTDLLVIDEADRMLDMGFIPDIERIVSLLPRRRQTLFFSATMAPEIRRLADNFLNSPKEITVARQSSVASTITEGLLVVEKKDKNRALCALLRQDDVQNAIIFCNRKRDVDTLERHLTRQKFSVGHLHGDLTQDLRFETLERFRTGDLQILVCSDVAARGIDIGGLSHVFNYDLPFNAEDYVHRIGRTGRAGKEGKAYSLATPDEQKLLEAVESLTGKTIEPLTVKGFRHLEWRGEEDASPASAKDESKGQQRGGRNRKTAEPKQEDRPARKKQPERDPLPEARKHDHKRSGRAELLPPVPEKNGMQDGFGENVPAFMKVSFLPEPRDPSES
ncbi:DNA helicase [Bombella sp. TMW2.1889]|uniref:DNA helicase n=1 Tax=Bombella mellum TaxID=2039288 RepID=A0ABR5ZSH0_9PROT|nr:DNA helicase [Bombella mellum]